MIFSKFLTATILANISLLTVMDPASADDTKVQGSVILSGAPLTGGKITLHLASGEFLGVSISNDGTYAFEKLNVPTGNYAVTISGKGIRERYQNEKTTPLKIEVWEGENTFNFDLQ